MPHFAGIDVGGTRTKAVLVARDGDAVVSEVVRDTPQALGDDAPAHVTQVLADLGGAPAAVGVVVPGLVDDRSGVAIWSVNLGWRDLDLPAQVSAASGVPAVGGHDVRAGLLAEATRGAGRGCENVLFVPLGTGVASALMSAGRVVSGSPWAGEIGHVRVGTSQALCGCGARGCLESVVGVRALSQRWQEMTGRPGTAAELAEAVAAGETAATEIWAEALLALAQILAPAVAVAGVERVIIGGGLSNAGEVLLAPLRRELSERIPGREVEIVRAALGDRAAALGAVELARAWFTQGSP
ncbi:MAG: ROK family protein [Ornithinimicrobium sp.]